MVDTPQVAHFTDGEGWVRSRPLVIVDMQVERCERHGPGVKPVIGSIRRLLDRFRAVKGKIIHVQSVRTKDHPEFTIFGRPHGLLIGSPGADFVEELKPLQGESIVQNLVRLFL
jgi:nicotinamidase-related amidase